MLVTLRVGVLSLILAAKPTDVWSFSSLPLLDESYPALTVFVGWNLVPGGIIVALVHIWLLRPKYRASA